jgi:UPF0042 nucleotide-binding protein
VSKDRPLEMTIITGLSGAGKSEAVATFEDTGYFCIDNLPPQMLSRVVELFTLDGSRVDRVALVFDVRGGDYFKELGDALSRLQEWGVKYRLLFLEASEDALVARYQATRRRHPLSGESVSEGIRRERAMLEGLRDRADVVIDTTSRSPRELRRLIEETLLSDELTNQVFLSLVSFGYKYGVPEEADLVLDARFVPNPHWVPELRRQTGLDDEVRAYVLDREESREFLDRVAGLIRFLAPRYVSEQKRRVVLAMGCTGGRHRSVVMVEALQRMLEGDAALLTSVSHRDLQKSE